MKTGGPCRFVLEAIDDKTESIATDVSFDANDVELCRMIGATATEFGSSAVYELQAGAVVQLKARFKIALDATTAIVRLRRWQPQDDLPYKIHTGRELTLMLEGSKPLAWFSGQHPPASDVEEIPERLFDPFVENERFVKREYVMLAAYSGPRVARQRAQAADSDVCTASSRMAYQRHGSAHGQRGQVRLE